MTPDDAFHIGQLPSSYLIYRRGTRKPYFAFYIYINHPFHSLTAKSRKFFGATKKGNWDTIYGRDPARADVRKSSHVSRRATSKQATGKKKTRDLWRRSSSSFRGTVVCSITERANDSRSYTNAGTGPSPVRLQISMQLGSYSSRMQAFFELISCLTLCDSFLASESSIRELNTRISVLHDVDPGNTPHITCLCVYRGPNA